MQMVASPASFLVSVPQIREMLIQPRAIIGDWNIGNMRLTADTTQGTTTLKARDTGSDTGSTLEGVYGADLVVP